MPIHLPEQQTAAIRAQGEAAFPHECCGFLLGRVAADGRWVQRTEAVANARAGDDRKNRYTIAPEDFLRGEKLARAEGMDIVGFYHSHPDAPARPSAYDVEHAWPWYSYVIVSVQDGCAGDLTSWVLEDDRSRFNQEEIVADC